MPVRVGLQLSLTGSWTGILQLWNAETGRLQGHPVLVANAPVEGIRFAPSGKRFVTTGGADGSTKLWFTSSQQQEGSDIAADPGTWSTATFLRHGSQLLTFHDDGTGELIPATAAAWERQACTVAGRQLTREEWKQFVSDRHYAQVCP